MLDEPEFVSVLRERAAKGDEIYEYVLCTVDSIRAKIEERNAAPTPGAYFANALSLLDMVRDNCRPVQWSSVNYILVILRSSMGEISANMKAKLSNETVDTLKEVIGRLTREMETEQQHPSANEQQLRKLGVDGSATRSHVNLLKMVFEILAHLMEVVMQKKETFCIVKKAILDTVWPFAASVQVPVIDAALENGPAVTSSSTSSSSKALQQVGGTRFVPNTQLNSSMRHKAGHVLTSALKYESAARLEGKKCQLHESVSKYFAQHINVGMHQIFAISSLGITSEESLKKLKALLGVAKEGLPWVSNLQHAQLILGQLLDAATKAGVNPISSQIFDAVTAWSERKQDMEDDADTETFADSQGGNNAGESETLEARKLQQSRDLVDAFIGIKKKIIKKPKTDNVQDKSYISSYVRMMGAVQAGLQIVVPADDLASSLEGMAIESPKNLKTTGDEDYQLLDKMLRDHMELHQNADIQKLLVETCKKTFESTATRNQCIAIFRVLQEILEAQYKPGYQTMFLVLAEAFSAYQDLKRESYFDNPNLWDLCVNEVAGDRAPVATRLAEKQVYDLLDMLRDIHDSAPNREFYAWVKEAQTCVQRAIGAFGPKAVLKAFPFRLLEADFNSATYERDSRSWLLFLLKKSTVHARIDYFRKDMLQLALKLRKRAQQCEKQDRLVFAKKYQALVEQIWALFPSFMNQPVDAYESLQAENDGFPKLLTTIIKNEPSLRDSAAEGWARLCKHTYEAKIAEEEMAEESEQSVVRQSTPKHVEVLTKFTNKMITSLFESYLEMHKTVDVDVSTRNKSANILLEAIKWHAMCVRGDQVHKMFENVAIKLVEDSQGFEESCKAVVAADMSFRGKTKISRQIGGEDAMNDSTEEISRLATMKPLLEAKIAAERQLSVIADCAAALVPAIPLSSLDVAYRTFDTILKQIGSTGTQKACYRGIRAVFEHEEVVEVNGDQLGKFWSILREARATCEPGAFKARLQAITAFLKMLFGDSHEETEWEDEEEDSDDEEGNEYWEGHKGSAVKRVVHIPEEQKKAWLSMQLVASDTQNASDAFLMSELLARSHEVNINVRRLARDCMYRVFRAAIVDFQLSMELIGAVCADLTSKSRAMKAHSVDALAKLVFEHHDDIEGEVLDQMCEVVLLLMRDSDRQVYRSVLKFTKVMTYFVPLWVLKKRTIAYQSSDAIDPEVTKTSTFIYQLLENPNADTCRILLRKIVEKLVKRFCFSNAGEEDVDSDAEDDCDSGEVSWDELQAAFPHKHVAMLHHVQKDLVKRYKKKLRLQAEERESKKSSFSQFFTDDKEAGESSNTREGRKRGGLKEDDGVAQVVGKKRRRGASTGSQAETDVGEPRSEMLDAWENEGEGDEYVSGNRKKARRMNKTRADASGEGKNAKPLTWVVNNSDAMDLSSAQGMSGQILTLASNATGDHHEGMNTGRSTDSIQDEDKTVTVGADGKITVHEEDSDYDEDDSDGEYDGNKTTYGKQQAKNLGDLTAVRQKMNKQRRMEEKKKKEHKVQSNAISTDNSRRKTKARGDAKKSGQTNDPYAYIALNPRLTKEKHRAKALKAFSSVGIGKAPERGNKAKKLNVRKKGGKKRKR